MVNNLYNIINWFLEACENIANTFYNLLSFEIDLTVVGLGRTNLLLVLLGSGLLILIIYKILQWITPIV